MEGGTAGKEEKHAFSTPKAERFFFVSYFVLGPPSQKAFDLKQTEEWKEGRKNSNELVVHFISK